MKEKLKKNWHIIVIAILLLFSMNKCATSCTRGHVINDLNTKIEKMDSAYNANVDSLNLVINHQGHMIDILNERLTGANNLNSAVSAERKKTNEANNRASEANRRAEQLRKQNEQLKKKTEVQ